MQPQGSESLKFFFIKLASFWFASSRLFSLSFRTNFPECDPVYALGQA
jgi:hypothetical protein